VKYYLAQFRIACPTNCRRAVQNNWKISGKFSFDSMNSLTV